MTETTGKPDTAMTKPAFVILLHLLVLAAITRIDTRSSIYFPDEYIAPAVVAHMEQGPTLDTNWEHANWSVDWSAGIYHVKQYNFSSYHTSLLLLSTISKFLGLPHAPDTVFLRATSVLFQLATVAVLFVLMYRLLNLPAAVLSAVFFVVAPQAIIDAHYIRPESFVMLLVALVVLCLVEAQRLHKSWPELVSAFLWGVLVACKFSFFPMILLQLFYHLLQDKPLRFYGMWVVALVAGIAVSAPYILLDPDGFVHGIRLLTHQYGNFVTQGNLFARWLPSAPQMFAYLSDFFGIQVFIVMLAALFIKKLSVRILAVAILACTVAYLVIFAHAGIFYERNLSHLVPLWAILFSIGAVAIYEWISGDWILYKRVKLNDERRKPLLGFLCVFILFSLLYMTTVSWPVTKYCFYQPGQLMKQVAEHDRQVLAQYPGMAMLEYQLEPNLNELASRGDSVVVKISAISGSQRDIALAAMQQQGYRRVDALPLPLGNLAFSQLQLIHFPAAYDYYVR